MNISLLRKRLLEAGVAVPALALLSIGFAAPAYAQEDLSDDCNTATGEGCGEDEEAIIVTGSILGTTTTSATVSPVTVLTEETLDRRGINTTQDAIQSLASNNGPALTNSFTANGAFAAGASAVSLRGLSTNSTLVLFDGQRAAYYPLADDGSRNFVDLNTIPDDIVQRIEVLRDGASSTYGADAIAGVVNIITRKDFTGLRARAEAGMSENGNNPTQRFSLTAGVGDIDQGGVNAYLSGFYFNQGATYARDLDSPFNDFDESDICYDDPATTAGEVCGPDNRTNAVRPLSAFGIGYDPYVQARVINAAGTGDAAAAGDAGRFQLLNPALGCQFGPGFNSTAAERATSGTIPLTTVCTNDAISNFQVTSPNIERFGLSGRVSARLSDAVEAYFTANFLQSTVDYTGFPVNIRAQANAGINFRPFSTASGPAPNLAPGSAELRLPVFVCPTGVASANGLNTGCTATTPGATLNPNNPFAAQGQLARILGRPFADPTFNETRTRAYRAALGFSGSLADWDWQVDATGMHVDLRRNQQNYIQIGNFLTAIAQGTINLVNPAANTQQQLDFVRPDNITNASSDLYQIQAIVSRDLFELPGGPLQIGVGGQIRYEAVDAPSANPDTNGPTNRFFVLNAFGTSGSREVYSAFAELNAPIFDFLEIQASGRFDSYSSGQEAFSPKIGAILTPIPQVSLRATYSQGFRIPSFGEANALPTTGFVNTNAGNFNDAFLAPYGCTVATFSTCPTYIRSNSYGQTTLASPNLQPEDSESFTAGIIVSPFDQLTFTLDYYDITKTGAITSPSNAPALAAYYANQPIPAGYNVIAGAPDTVVRPGSRPIIGFIEAQLVNANTQKARGIDGAVSFDMDITPTIEFATSVEASYILELSSIFPDGTAERYEGTLGNYNLTAGSGTPRVRGTWQNTIDFGDLAVTGTANYFSGYNLSAEDQGDTRFDCGLIGGSPTYRPCDVPEYITVDLVTQYELNENVQVYLNVLNLLDNLPPVDIATYGAFLYNPVQAGNGIFGRQFRVGARLNF